MTAWLIVSTLLHMLVYSAVGARVQAVIIASWASLVVAPGLSVLAYPDYDYSGSVWALALFTLALLVPVAIGGAAERQRLPSEAAVLDSSRLIPMLVLGLVVVAIANVFMYRIILQGHSVTTINELNVVMSSDDLPSVGLSGRISRMAMPLGVLAWTCALWTKDKARRRVLITIALLFLLSLVGVRRAVLFYELAFFLAVALVRARASKRLLRFVAGVMIAFSAVTAYFGYIQVETNKSSVASGRVLDSGLADMQLYVSGNFAYAECLSAVRLDLPYGISFPFVFNGFESLRDSQEELGKPFCRLPDGLLFNTSPLTYDLQSDFGLLGVVAFALVVGFGLSAAVRGRLNMVGVEAVLVGVVFFAFRENVLGSLDVVQFLIVYPVMLAWLKRGKPRSRSDRTGVPRSQPRPKLARPR